MTVFADESLGDGVTLALRRPEHTRGIFAAVDRSRDHLRPWFPWVDLTRTVADVEARAAVAFAQHERGELYEFVILDAGVVIGKVDLHSIRYDDSVALLGYWLAQEAQGRGLMTPAIARVIAFAFDHLGLRRLELRTSVTNARSRALAERLGFHLSAVPDADPRGDMGEATVRYIRTRA